MQKQILLSFLLILFCTDTSFAQDKISDSLKLRLKNAKHDTTRCNLLSKLVEATYPNAEYEKHNEQLRIIAETRLKTQKHAPVEQKIYKIHYANALNNIGFTYYNQDNTEKALEYYHKSLKIREEVRDKYGLANSFQCLAAIYDGRGDLDKALTYYNKSLNIKKEIDDKKGIAYVLNDIGAIYYNQGDIPKALEYYEASLKIQEKTDDKIGIATTLNNIGYVYYTQDDHTKALEYYSKSIQIKEKIGDQLGVSIGLINLGLVYHKKLNYKKAHYYYDRSLKISEEIGDKSGIAYALNNLGALCKDQGDITKAMEYIVKSLKISEEIENKELLASSLNNIGMLFVKQKDYANAEKFGERSLSLSQEVGLPSAIRNAAEILYTVHKQKGEGEKALKSYELYILMRDSINNEATRKASIKSQLKYEYEKKAAADSVRVAEEKKVVAVQLKQEKTQRLALYGGLALVALFAGFMFNRFRITQKQKNIIELKEKETQQQNEVITLQKRLVEEKHKEITDSITYAERIQRSFLATKELLDASLKDHFVFFKPKDIVSGDFYWASKLISSGDENFVLCTADSTGHGVPGAIMSLLNVTSLEKAIEHHTNPADILNHTRQTIIERLKKDGSADGGKDGMDCSLLMFNFSNKQLHIAAANNPVWIIRSILPLPGSPSGVEEDFRQPASGGVELIEIKPDKMPVGKSERQNESFTLHTIKLQQGDMIYALTDGFPDQFGGPKGKKFMSKNLKELLLANAHLSISQQKGLLENTFKNWVGDLEQVDDVTIIGIRI